MTDEHAGARAAVAMITAALPYVVACRDGSPEDAVDATRQRGVDDLMLIVGGLTANEQVGALAALAALAAHMAAAMDPGDPAAPVRHAGAFIARLSES